MENFRLYRHHVTGLKNILININYMVTKYTIKDLISDYPFASIDDETLP